MHELLRRQLRQSGITLDAAPRGWTRLLDLVNDAYVQQEIDLRFFARDASERLRQLANTNKKLVSDIERLEHTEATRYQHLFERSLAGVFLAAMDGRLLDFNDAFMTMLGYKSREELMALSLESLYVNPSDGYRYTRLLHQTGTLANAEVALRCKEGGFIWVLWNVTLIDLDMQPPQPRLIQGTMIDITARRELEETLTHQAYHDVLTDLPNRLYFTEYLAALLQSDPTCRQGALVYLDLDHFKTINDSLGYHAGDRALQQLANRLASFTQNGEMVARFSGDQFVLLLRDVVDTGDALRRTERIALQTKFPVELGGVKVVVTASAGVVYVPDAHTQDAEELLRFASIALREAKRRRHDRTVLYTPDMEVFPRAALQLENEIRNAIETWEFALHYQPIVNIANRRVVEVEALVRWQHPTRGLLMPQSFIPFAEASGLMLPLEQKVLAEACQQAGEWYRATGINLTVSVNLSAEQVQHPQLMDLVQSTLADHRLPSHLLKIEITERVAIDEPESAIRTLNELKAIGVRIALDDFGTGYSALNYLKKFPIDTLKIDRSFIQELTESNTDSAIVQATVAYARALHLSVVAEGVENIDQLRRLQAMGCDLGQGYYFAPPMPASEVGRLLMGVAS